jgi:hypothetical protein
VSADSRNRIQSILSQPPQRSMPASESPAPASEGRSSPSGTAIRPALPQSPFGPKAVTAAGGGVKFNAANIEAFGGKLMQAVGGEITSARRHLNEKPREVEWGAFRPSLAGMMAVDVVAQTVTGNTKAMPDFAESFVNSADDVAKGRLALMEQKLTAQLMGGKKIGGFGLGKWTLPTKHLPKDLRPYISPLVGIKGSGDVGTGSPLFTNRWTGGVQYGDDYVNRTNPLPATDS